MKINVAIEYNEYLLHELDITDYPKNTRTTVISSEPTLYEHNRIPMDNSYIYDLFGLLPAEPKISVWIIASKTIDRNLVGSSIDYKYLPEFDLSVTHTENTLLMSKSVINTRGYTMSFLIDKIADKLDDIIAEEISNSSSNECIIHKGVGLSADNSLQHEKKYSLIKDLIAENEKLSKDLDASLAEIQAQNDKIELLENKVIDLEGRIAEMKELAKKLFE